MSKKKFSTHNETDQNKKELGKRKKFHPHDLKSLTPKNDRQEEFFEVFYSGCPVVVQDGPAGTGKTYLALYAAMSETFEEATPYNNIIVIRSAVEARTQGFLPGDKDEKNEPFERPYDDIVNSLTEFNSTYDHMKTLGVYEFMTTSHLRGLTWDNTIVIVDEAQNMDIKELSTIFTRLGQHSKLIICGDTNQDDLFRKREKSGFDRFKQILNLMPYEMTATIRYGVQDIVRSQLVKQFIIAEMQLGD